MNDKWLQLLGCGSVLLLCLWGGSVDAQGVPVAPLTSTLQQPDGTAFRVIPFGDERFNGLETEDGYTILLDEATKYWVYARLNARGDLVPSNLRVGIDPPAGIPKHARPSRGQPRPVPPPGAIPQGLTPQHAPSLGTQRFLVILVEFTDRGPVGTSASDWNTIFFGGFPSLADYYDEVSYGQLAITPAAESHGTSNDGIVGWLNVGYAHPNTGFCPQPPYANELDCRRANAQLVRDALVAADLYVNFAAFDDDGNGSISRDELLLYVVVAGYEAAFGSFPVACLPNVWGHQSALGYWYDVDGDGVVDPGEVVDAPVLDGKTVGHYSDSGYAMSGEWHNLHPSPDPAHPTLPANCDASDLAGHQATPGIKIHETGHLLQLPDLYDVGCDGSANSSGAGDWEVMAGGSWNWSGAFSGDWATIGDRPAHMSAWSKWYKGWLTPVEITGPQVGVSIPRVEDAPGPSHGVYQLGSNPGTDNPVDWHFDGGAGGSGEYFLVENRQLVGYDEALPGSGLLIWHIYEALPGDNCVNADEGTSPPGNPRLVVLEQADGLFGLECYSGSFGDPTCNGGDSTDPWYSGNATTFDDTTTPNSKFYSGTSSGACVTHISASGATMTADMGVSGCPAPGTAAVFRVENDGDVFSDRAYFCGLSSNCFNTGTGADLAERIDVSEPVEPGDVVEIDPTQPRHYRKARSPYSTLVAGVIVAVSGFVLANLPEELKLMELFNDVQLSKPLLMLTSLLSSSNSSFIPKWSVASLASSQVQGIPKKLEIRVSVGQLLQWKQRSIPGRPLLALMGRIKVKATTENGPIQPGDLLVSASTPGYVMRCPDPQECEGAIIGKALEPLDQGTGLILMLVMR